MEHQRALNHPHCAAFLNILATAFSRLCGRTGAEEDLDKVMGLYLEVLKNCPANHPNHLHALATVFHIQYKQMGKKEDINESIWLHTESLKLFQPGHPDHVAATHTLATSLEMRYHQLGLVEDLDRSIQLQTGLVETQSPTHPQYSSFQMALGVALCSRYHETGAKGDLKKSIQLFTQLLKVLPSGHPNHVTVTYNLAASLEMEYHLSGSVETLERSIQLLTGLLETHSSTHPLYCSFQNTFGTALFSRYRRTGAEGDLKKSIHICTELLKVLPPGHSDHVTATKNLAISLAMQYAQSGLVEDLDRSIQLLTGLLETQSATCPQYSSFQVTLAEVLLYRYQITGVEEDLKENVQLCKELLKVLPPHHPHHATATYNLAISLNMKYRQLGLVQDLDKSIQLLTGLLETHSPTHPQHSYFQGGLASAFSSRYQTTLVEGDLQKSIQLYLELEVSRASVSHPEYPGTLLVLGGLFLTQYRQTSREPDLEQSLCYLRNGRDLCPHGHPLHASATHALADGLWVARAINNSSSSDTEEIFGILRGISHDFISPLRDSLACTIQWVNFAFQAQDSAMLSEAYNYGIQFLRRYLAIGPTMRLQYDALSRDTEILSLPIDAASHFIQQNNIERAIEVLDEGRSLLWSEGQRFRKPLSYNDQLDANLVERFESTRTKLQKISTAEVTFKSYSSNLAHTPMGLSYNNVLPQKRKLLEDYDEILNCIQQNPGFEDYLQSSPFEKLKEAAKEGPIIIVNCSPVVSHIIILYANTPPFIIGLEKDFYTKAVEYHGAYLEARASTVQGKAFRSRLQPILEWLWEDVVSKVVNELKMAGVAEGSRIWWCPTSVLTVLPFHAAGYETKGTKEYLMDSYISSYTPTLQALIDARQSPPQSKPGQPVKLLVVGQTDLTLKYAEAEVKAICELGPFVNCLVEKDATQEQVLKELPSHQWAHFVCHGTLAPLPFDSSLHLFGGDKLTMGDIIQMNHSNAHFAFLAACHSAEQTPAGLSDEVLHLAGAMLFSGFQSVVGTMWEMVDKDGPIVAKWFYEEMLSDDQPVHTRAAQALWKVTKRMKDEKKIGRDGKEKAVYPLERWVNFIHIGA
ncbi:hypothetical protein L218DRAFT_886780 [Marasmius fiardii PR-910]|nr:hypothetical protein L218DRAFT_886780 [Marasmius fiardii PR-910]